MSDLVISKNFTEYFADLFDRPPHLSLRAAKTGTDPELELDLVQLSEQITDPDFCSRYLHVPRTGSIERQVEWAESRRCLLNVIRTVLMGGAEPQLLLISLSHCRSKGSDSQCIAIAAQRTPRQLGVGIDIEFRDRKISPEAIRRIIHSNESPHLEIPPLVRWTVKEACFKADPKNLNQVIANYWITQFNPINGSGRARCLHHTGLEFFFRAQEFDGLIVTVAVAKWA